MKKTLLASALSLACAGAFAANVDLYGAVDAFVAVNNDSGTVSSALSSGGSTGNYFGFKGSENLWEGVQAAFKLEAGFLGDDGTFAQSFAGNTNRLFHREAWVGLRGAKFGQISFGRQYTPHFLLWAMTDVNGLSLGTASSPFFFPSEVATMGGDNPLLDGLVRRNNSIFWASPNLGGATIMAYAALGESKKPNGSTSSTRDNVYNIAVNYSAGPLFVMASYLYQDFAKYEQTVRPHTAKNAQYAELAVTYDFGVTKAAVQLEYKKLDGTKEAPDIFIGQIGATTPCLGGRVNTTAAMLKDFDRDEADGYSVGIRYDYDLSKRTMVYAGIEALWNDKNVARSIEAGPDSSLHFATTAPGNDVQQLFVGMRHRF